LAVSEDSDAAAAGPALPSCETNFGTELTGGFALSHAEIATWYEFLADGPYEWGGAEQPTPLLDWPPDLFGQPEVAATAQPQANAECRGRLLTTFNGGETTDPTEPSIGDSLYRGDTTIGEAIQPAMRSTDRTLQPAFGGGRVRSTVVPEEQPGHRHDTQAIADVASWLTAMKPVLRLAFPAKLALYVAAGEGIWPIATDKHKLSAVLFELAMNARDAMAGVGTVAIGARNMAADEPRRDGVPPGENVVISLRSNRAGMAGDLLMWVPETFFETTDTDQWMGGALPKAKAFLQTSGGAIVVRTVLEKITAVDIIVPRANAGRDRRRQALDRKMAAARTIKILVVDDDEVAREVAVEILQCLGYTVVSAATAQSAYNTVMSSMNIDLVISDVVMPDIGGVTLAGMLRTFKPELPVVFTTGYPHDFILLEEMVLAKPFTVGDLEVLVARGLDRGGVRH